MNYNTQPEESDSVPTAVIAIVSLITIVITLVTSIIEWAGL